MTVGELKKALELWPDELPVVLSRDAEGNEHRPLFEVGHGYYEAEAEWYGHATETADDAGPDAKLVVILWPVN